MARIVWDDPAERYYETGISQAVLFLRNEDGTYETGVPWNGLTSVSENYDSIEPINVYYSSDEDLDIYDNRGFSITLQAYTYPDEFESCIGFEFAEGTSVFIGQQNKMHFGLCYRTQMNDTYKLHILYDCAVEPIERQSETIGSEVNPELFSWDIKVYPQNLDNYDPVPVVVLDPRKGSIDTAESCLYGTSSSDSYLPSITELISLFS